MVSIAHKFEEKLRTEDVFIENNYTFDNFILSPAVGRGLQEAGFYKPSPIQVKAIPLGKCGLDLIVKAKSGTGKTLVFTVIALEMIKVKISKLQVLIIAPTREIADQIVDVIKTVGKYIEGLNVGLFIGGLSYNEDLLRTKNCHIAVGAPGRIKHLVEQKHLNLNTVKLIVLDEADKLMTEGFQSDINYFYHMLPEQKQFLAVSATMANELNTFLEKYMHSPTLVSPGIDNSLLLGLRQFVSVVDEKNTVVQQFKTKLNELIRIFTQIPFAQCLVFSNYQQRTESISNMLNQQGWNSMFITGSQSQAVRLKVVGKLKNFECKILLTTDLTARGIDASNVNLVINYDLPADSETYLHRMGRSGRYGSSGICITIASKGKELIELQHILGDVGGKELQIAQLPTGVITEDLWKCDMNGFEKVQGVVDTTRKKLSWEMPDDISKNKKSKHAKKNVSKKFRELSVEDCSRSDTENNKNLESIQTLLEVKENSSKNILEKYSEVDTESVLQSLAQGKLPEVSKNSEELLNPADLYPWVPVEEPVLLKSTGLNLLESDDDSSICSEDHLPMNKVEIPDKKLTLAKNIALYHACRILQTDDWNDVIEEATKPIGDYFSMLEKEAAVKSKRLLELTQGVEISEICNKLDFYSEQFAREQNSSKVLKEETSSRNICRVAYDYIVKGEENWRNMIPKRESKDKHKPNDHQDTMEVIDFDEEYDNRYPSYDFNTVDEYNEYSTESETFKNYYDYYDRALAETAPTFEDVPTFRNWYRHWKTQVQSVTRCVQEKIYLAEMNKFKCYNSADRYE
ncbi:hypothetical protein FQR65_LT05767 [Abscondita terminalis]|nr:hypothetical protein FQR65_LT05767 [Abscondita terminalis]